MNEYTRVCAPIMRSCKFIIERFPYFQQKLHQRHFEMFLFDFFRFYL